MSETLFAGLLCFAIFSLGGWIIAFAGIRASRGRRLREELEHTRATGRIVDYAPQKKADAALQKPVIEFIADGQPYRLEYENRLDRTRYPVGSELDLLYSVSDPTRFHLEADATFFREGRSLLRMGLGWIAFSALLIGIVMVMVDGAPNLNILWHQLRRGGSVEKVDAPVVTASNGAFSYRMQPDYTAVIDGYTGSDARLTLPLVLDGHPVTGITSSAFRSASTLTALTVPGAIANLPTAAFAGCVALRELTIEEGVQSIDGLAFSACISLERVSLPKSLTRIADGAFPSDCAAHFHVVRGSAGERYCLKNGFQIQVDF